MEEQKRPIVIVGGGFGGLRIAQVLSKHRRLLAGRPVLLIDKHAHHVYTPLLYEVASGCTMPGEMGPELVRGTSWRYEQVVRAGSEASYVHDEAVALDMAKKIVRFASGKEIAYEKLVLATGSETDFFGIPGLRERAMTLKTRQDALDLRARIAEFMERKKAGHEVELKIFIGGGGATGVELAAETAGCFRQMERRKELSPSDWTVTLVEALPRLASMLKPELSKQVKARLESLGVKVHLDTCIKRVEDDHIILSPRPLREGEKMEELVCEFRAEFEKRFDADLIVWTGGVRGSAVLAALGLPVDRKGRVAVSGDLRLPGQPDVFVVGDAAALANPVTKEAVPMLAQAAIKEGDVAASQILADLGAPVARRSYAFPRYPTVLPLGGKSALLAYGNFSVGGFLGWLIRQAADLRYFLSVLPFRQAIRAFVHGAWMYTRND